MTHFRVDPEHLVPHRPADTYDVVHADNYELVIANVTHQQAAFIASVLNGRTEADIQAEALEEAAVELEQQGVEPWDRNSVAIRTLRFRAERLRSES